MIVTGNKARDAQDWPAAASAYRDALEADPSLSHIWVQLGHALKEQRDLEGCAGRLSDGDGRFSACRRSLAPSGASPQGTRRSGSGQSSYMRALRQEPPIPTRCAKWGSSSAVATAPRCAS